MHGRQIDKSERSPSASTVERVGNRLLDELAGMIRMALSDGALERAEVEFIVAWMHAHPPVQSVWPGDVIYKQLSGALTDNEGYDAHEESLLALLNQSVGGAAIAFCSTPTRLPFTEKTTVRVRGSVFCLTGRFETRPRPQLEELLRHAGAEVVPRVTKQLTHLVIGSDGSRDWLHSNFGLKIKRAVELNESGKARIAIVSEYDLASALNASVTTHQQG